MVTIIFNPIETHNMSHCEMLALATPLHPDRELRLRGLHRQLRLMAKKIVIQATEFALQDRRQANIELGV